MRLTCDCQNITIEWQGVPSFTESRRCACSYCQEQQAEYVSHPDSSFSYCINDPDQVVVVQHGHKTASFFQCTNCGLAFATSKIQGNDYGIINARVMGYSHCSPATELKDYSGESVDARQSRRAENWCKITS